MSQKQKKWGAYNQTAKVPMQYIISGSGQKPASPSSFAQTGSVVRQSNAGQITAQKRFSLKKPNEEDYSKTLEQVYSPNQSLVNFENNRAGFFQKSQSGANSPILSHQREGYQSNYQQRCQS